MPPPPSVPGSLLSAGFAPSTMFSPHGLVNSAAMRRLNVSLYKSVVFHCVRSVSVRSGTSQTSVTMSHCESWLTSKLALSISMPLRPAWASHHQTYSFTGV